jgi:hypothetical protein
MSRTCSAHGRDEYKMLVGKPEGKRLLGRARRRWRIILKWILRKYGLRCRLDTSGSV